MSRLRVLAPLLFTVALGVAACGGGSSGGSSSAGASTSSSTGGAAAGGSGSDKAFCDTFASAQTRFTNITGLPSGDDIKKIKDFANDLDKTAPSSIKSDVSVLSDYFRFIADAASKATGGNADATPSNLPSEIAKVGPAIANVSVWSSTHCASSSAPSVSVPSSVPSFSVPSSLPSVSVPSSLPSFSVPSLPSFSTSALAS